MPWLIPDDIEPLGTKCITFQVPDDPQWIANFWGAINELGKNINHERDAAHSAIPVSKRWREVIDQALEGCPVLEDIRIVEGGILEKKFCGSDWIEVGEVDGGGDIDSAHATTLEPDQPATAEIIEKVLELGIPRGYQGIQGIQGIPGIPGIPGQDGQNCMCDPSDIYNNVPSIEDEDRYCFAAWELARGSGDDCKDAALLIGTLIGTGAQFADSAVDAFLSYYPILGSGISALLEFLVENYDSWVIDYFVPQFTDIDTHAFVAEELFCAMKQAAPNFENIFDYIEFPIDFPNPVLLVTDTKKVLFDNFWQILNYAYDHPTLTAPAGVIVLAFMKAMKKATDVGNSLGIKDPWESGIINMLNQAENFDDRNCSDFGCYVGGWCRSFDLAEGHQGWELISVDGHVYGIDGGTFYTSKLDIWEDSNPALGIHVPEVGEAEVIRVKVTYSTANSSWGVTFNEVLVASPLNAGNNQTVDVELEFPVATIIDHPDQQFKQSTIYFGSNEPGAYLVLHSIEIEGTGNMPYAEGVDCEGG